MGGEASGQAAGGDRGVRSWALSPAESVQQERDALLYASSQASSDACLHSAQDADEEEGEEESDEEESDEEIGTHVSDQEADQKEREESDVVTDGAERCFLANADEMQEVEVSSCTPSSEQDRAQPATLPQAAAQHEKRELEEREEKREMEEDAEALGAQRDGRAVSALNHAHAASDCNHLDPISEFERAVSARGHGRVEQRWLPAQGQPSPRTRKFQSDGGQEAKEESSSEVTEFAEAMGACDALGRCSHSPPFVLCHPPPFMARCLCAAAVLLEHLLLLRSCCSLHGKCALTRQRERALGFRSCVSGG